MINSFSIENFKGIKNCSIDDLGTINLFIGKNNSGKSSILEALCFAKVPFQPVDELGRIVLRQLLNRRVKRSVLSPEEFVHNYKPKNIISMKFSFDENETVSLKANCTKNWVNYSFESLFNEENITLFSVRNRLSSTTYLLSSLGQRLGNDTPDTIGFLKQQVKPNDIDSNHTVAMKKYLKDSMNYFECLSNIELIDDNFIKNMEQFERDFWGKLLDNRTDKEVTSILNDIYHTGIEHFTFKPYNIDKGKRQADTYKLFSALSKIALHIDDYGDGFRFAFSLLTTALLFKNRILLIEEIESHQHAGSLKKLIPKLVEIANANNLQLFITTHSFDVWRFLYGAYPDQQTRQQNFRSFHVSRDSNTGDVDVSQEYSIAKIKEAIFEIEY